MTYQLKTHPPVVIGLCFMAQILLPQVSFAAEESPTQLEGAKTINAKEAKALWQQGATFIDTRKDSDWAAGRIPGALHVNVKTADYNANYIARYINKSDPVVTYCNAEKCHRAYKGAKKLVEFGYNQVFYFRLGFPAWKNSGFPYE